MIRAALLTVLALASVACAANTSEPEIDETGAASTDASAFYGDDRVGDVLRARPESIPADFPAFERLFQVGRACPRTDSKEIFVVEEEQTRLAGSRELHEVTKTPLMPRAVVTGCNAGDRSDPNSVESQLSLMAALISDPDAPGAASGDTLLSWPVEVMALDRKTGLYNFYLFEPKERPSDARAPLPDRTPGRVTRIYRAIERRPGRAGTGAWNVFQRRLEAGAPVSAEAQPAGGGNRCFNCHVNGGPLLNELRDPWKNWVSFRNLTPVGSMSGFTRTLVDESMPSAETGRASLANDLEPVMREAIRRYVHGRPRRDDGWARASAAGRQPGTIASAMRSAFCETEVNYASSSDLLPTELFLDADVAQEAGLVPPAAFADALVPFQLPVRSVFDREVERWLVAEGWLAEATVRALRVLDDENEVFSDVRCGLHGDVTAMLPASPRDAAEHVRRTLAERLDSLPSLGATPKRTAFVRALLTPGIRRDVAEREYHEELATRYAARDKSERAVKAIERARKTKVRAMFPGRSTPMPLLDGR